MGRTFGPFTDVSTVRVDGAYEIYTGLDADGAQIEILTLGTTSSKDPTRRALLSDTVAWAHATRGPVDALIQSADLNSEQPYVVAAVEPGKRGVERLLERMLAMGPSTGPLPVATGAHTGQLPAVGSNTGQLPVVNGHHTDPFGIPPVASTPPSGSPVAPASPMTSYVTKEQRSRPPWLFPVVAVLILLVLAAGGFFVYYGIFADEASSSDEVQDEQTPQVDQDAEPAPEWDRDAQLIVVGSATFSADEGDLIAERGWPFAFKVAEGLECDADDMTIRCEEEDLVMTISLNDCPKDCNKDIRAEMESAWENAGSIDRFTRLREDVDDDGYSVSMSRFFKPQYNTDTMPDFMQLELTASGPGDAAVDIHPMVNDVASQTRP